MPTLQRFCIAIIVLCFLSMVLIAMLVPSVRGQGGLFQIEGPWGNVLRTLLVVFVLSSFVSLTFRLIRREELLATKWPAARMESDANLDARWSYADLRATFEKETESWVISARGQNIAAFRALQDDIGEELLMLDRRYTVARSPGRYGGALMLDESEVATGRMKVLTNHLEITTGGKTYSIRQKSFTVFRACFRMILDRSEIYRYQQQFDGAWVISGTGDVDLFILVFGFWLIQCPADDYGTSG